MNFDKKSIVRYHNILGSILEVITISCIKVEDSTLYLVLCKYAPKSGKSDAARH